MLDRYSVLPTEVYGLDSDFIDELKTYWRAQAEHREKEAKDAAEKARREQEKLARRRRR